jgi:hypothetical protein
MFILCKMSSRVDINIYDSGDRSDLVPPKPTDVEQACARYHPRIDDFHVAPDLAEALPFQMLRSESVTYALDRHNICAMVVN